MTSKHTPGPWQNSPIEGKPAFSIRAGQTSIATIHKNIGSPVLMDRDGEGEANARLIAAAPDLLAALEIVLIQLGEHKDGMGAAHYHAVKIGRAAIAKARGEP